MLAQANGSTLFSNHAKVDSPGRATLLSFPEQLFFMMQPDNRTLLSDPRVVIEGKKSQETWNFSPGISL